MASSKLKIGKKVKQFLFDLGLTENEILIYLSLLKLGPCTILELSRESGVKRSTAHNIVEQLISKGIVSQTNFGKRRKVIAEEPEKLQVLIENKKWAIKKLEDSVRDIVESIEKTLPKRGQAEDVDVKYYDGNNGFRDVVQRALKSGTDEILIISNVSEFYRIYKKEYDDNFFIPARVKKGISVRSLILDDPLYETISKFDKEQLRETRILPTNERFVTTMYIYKKEVSIMVSNEPYKAVVITNGFIADTFRILFDLLWDIAKIK
jgi:sugar-specific transcriptional regulator TrmB